MFIHSKVKARTLEFTVYPHSFYIIAGENDYCHISNNFPNQVYLTYSRDVQVMFLMYIFLITLLFKLLHCSEGSEGACPVAASYILHNSLAYGADWSSVSLEDPAPCSPPATEPKESHTESGGHLRIQYESPTASFDTSLEDDAGRYIPEGTAAPSTTPAAVPALNPDGDAPSMSCLLASCSFYDHMLHVWRWDWTPDEAQQECWPRSEHCLRWNYRIIYQIIYTMSQSMICILITQWAWFNVTAVTVPYTL